LRRSTHSPGPEDCHDTPVWSHDNAAELEINPKLICIGGVSAGAGMAAGVTRMNRDLNHPAISFQYLLYPMLDNLHDTLSGKKRWPSFVESQNLAESLGYVSRW